MRWPWRKKRKGGGGPLGDLVVVMYTRAAGCHLCEETYGVLEDASRREGFRLDIVPVDDDPELEKSYGYRVPVVTIDGAEAFNYRVEPAQLRRKLYALSAARKQ